MRLWPRRKPGAPGPARFSLDGPVRIDIPELRVNHVIERRIPRPTRVTFQVQRPDGSYYQLMPMDLSYKDSFDVYLPLGQIFNDPKHAYPDLRLRAELHYDPKDRS